MLFCWWHGGHWVGCHSDPAMQEVKLSERMVNIPLQILNNSWDGRVGLRRQIKVLVRKGVGSNPTLNILKMSGCLSGLRRRLKFGSSIEGVYSNPTSDTFCPDSHVIQLLRDSHSSSGPRLRAWLQIPLLTRVIQIHMQSVRYFSSDSHAICPVL